MVHWNELSDFLKSNPFQTYAVKLLAIEAPIRKNVEHFPIVVDTPLVVEPEPVPVPVPATKKPLAAVASTAVIRSKQPEIQK